ncbi:MAG: hypothetical protein IPL55_21500 [Saprospiraceae bacterium]|jgi:hypothetical protein|nr:hypothetical protein [Saprospiraceae bacterium]
MTDATILLRQVHPSWIQGDIISQLVFTSQTFKPTLKDDGLLSVYHGDKFSPEEAFEHFTTTQGLISKGIVAVSKGECDTVPVDVLEDNNPFDGHCSLDYREMSSNEIKKTAGILKNYAQTKGWLYINDIAL